MAETATCRVSRIVMKAINFRRKFLIKNYPLPYVERSGKRVGELKVIMDNSFTLDIYTIMLRISLIAGRD
jgi:hypothetical protein